MISDSARDALRKCLSDRIEFDAPLSRHTSLRIGGPADAVATPANREELSALLRICSIHSLPTLVLGAGFNVLVREAGLRSVVIRLKKLRLIEREEKDLLFIESGASHATITRYCIDHALSGLEFAAGIPGTLGGWLAMNAGIGVREIKDVVVEIDLMEADGKKIYRLPRKDLDFRYRRLAGLPTGSILVGARLCVKEGEKSKIQSEIDRLLTQRQSTQPTDIPSCGSVFRNPANHFAGQLIESVGLKGTREGGAEISSVHANFIVNHGGATASDVLRLIDLAREKVAAATGIQLETEVKILGSEKADSQ